MADKRMTIRLSPDIEKKIDQLMETGRWHNRTDLVRDALWLGLRDTSKEMKK